MSSLSKQIDDRPTLVSLLQMFDGQVDNFRTAKTATKQDIQHSVISLSIQRFNVEAVDKSLRLVGTERVAQVQVTWMVLDTISETGA